MDSELDNLQKLLENFVFPFYSIERDMHLGFREKMDETDAEHSWALAFIVMAVTPQIDKTLDVNLAVKYALVHDLVEIYAGDLSVYDQSPATIAEKEKQEQAALHKITANSNNFPEIARLCNDYENQINDEAIFVKAMDKVVNWLTSLQSYESKHKKRRGITKNIFEDAFKRSRKLASRHPVTQKYIEEIYTYLISNPEYFKK